MCGLGVNVVYHLPGAARHDLIVFSKPRGRREIAAIERLSSEEYTLWLFGRAFYDLGFVRRVFRIWRF